MGYKLSIFFGYHDSCVTIADNKRVLLHLEAERFFRKKHKSFKDLAEVESILEAALEYTGISIRAVEEVYVSKWNNLFGSGNKIRILGKMFEPIMFGHHQSHIGCVLPAGCKDALIVCADGGSEDGYSKIFKYKRGRVSLIDDLDDTYLNGKYYGTITQLVIHPDCSLAHNHYAGKLMGLAALGDYSDRIERVITENIAEINKHHFYGCDELRRKFKISPDYERPWEDRRRCDLARTAQDFWVDEFVRRILKHRKISSNLLLTGGCALNVVLNTRLAESKRFDKVYVSPVSNDSAQSLGALLYANPHLKCEYPFLGRGYGEVNDIPRKLIDDLLDRKIVAWYQGASEIGPRALGHRSFLGLPDSIQMRDRLSIEIKKREPYRPVAPIVTADAATQYFHAATMSPFMTFNYTAKRVTKKLAPAVVHYDGSSRLQTVTPEMNRVLYDVLVELERRGRPPILMNTSFNVMGEPIVDTPEDAFRQFKDSGADVLYINGKRSIGV